MRAAPLNTRDAVTPVRHRPAATVALLLLSPALLAVAPCGAPDLCFRGLVDLPAAARGAGAPVQHSSNSHACVSGAEARPLLTVGADAPHHPRGAPGLRRLQGGRAAATRQRCCGRHEPGRPLAEVPRGGAGLADLRETVLRCALDH